jgi:succinate-semialdehyde dehydrogenase/glutarate-semialdehyde dehydrogenase
MAVQTLQRTAEYESVNPFDGKSFKTFVETTDAQLEAKIAAAQTCYETWRYKTYAERAAVVSKAAES